jgi:predicted RNA-binding Zn-ribbon protein involved in translation (DUF1610 family)
MTGEERYFEVLAITTRCPKCGDTVEDVGKSAAEGNFGAQLTCRKCGFVGELPE